MHTKFNRNKQNLPFMAGALIIELNTFVGQPEHKIFKIIGAS